MASGPTQEDKLALLIGLSRAMSILVGLLCLALAASVMRDGRMLDGVLIATIGGFSAICLYTLLCGLSVLIGLAQVSRYRAERDQEIDLALTEVRVLLKEQRQAQGQPSAAGSGSGLFRSSVMPFKPEDDAALTATRPALKS